MGRTIGVELEFVLPSRGEFKGAIKRLPSGFSLVSDGSVRTYREEINSNGLINPLTTSRIECGGEIVSPPLEIENIGVFYPIFKVLYYDLLEVPHATTSIHIHVYAGDLSHEQLLKLYRNSLKWEEFFFNVATPKDQTCHRGIHNDFIYCRPLESPPWARDCSSRTEGSSIGKILETESFSQMLYTLGNWTLRRNKWHPPRYVGINFCSLHEHQTVEFRVFNSTQDFSLFTAWTDLCKNFVDNLGEGDPSRWLSKKSMQTLLGNYRNTYGKINMDPVLSHLGSCIEWQRSSLDPKMSPVGTARIVENPKPMKKCLTIGQENYETRRIVNV